MTPAEKQAVVDLNRRIAESCACRCDLETGAIVSMCKEHQHIIEVARSRIDRLERKIEMMRARLLDARDHINGGAANVALVDINRALELSDDQPST